MTIYDSNIVQIKYDNMSKYSNQEMTINLDHVEHVFLYSALRTL